MLAQASGVSAVFQSGQAQQLGEAGLVIYQAFGVDGQA
jgi:hypothetical protein